jgi:hypothetical protein
MKTKKIKQRVNDYIHKHDICCENPPDPYGMISRRLVIDQLFRLYDEMSEHRKDTVMLNYLSREILWLMGGLNDMKTKEDRQMYLSIHRKMYKKGIPDKEEIVTVLHEIPLYYLMTLLGYAHYLHEQVLSDKLP